MYSTIDDLAKFVRALRAHRLLDPAHTAMMLKPHHEISKDDDYGYGLMFISGAWTGNWIGHSGGYPGMDCELWFSPATNYLVIVLSNTDPPFAHNVSDFVTARLPVP